MKHNMTVPCNNCPFRNDVTPYLTVDRVEEITDSLFRLQQSFACHKTTKADPELGSTCLPNSESEQCAGAMILMEREGRTTQMMRIYERIGMYDRSKLDMDAPVYATPEDMIEAYEDNS